MNLTEISGFIKQIESADLSQDSQFRDIVSRSKVILNLSDTDFAREIKISRLTIYRWKTGKNAPHVFMRDGIAQFLLKKARGLLK